MAKYTKRPDGRYSTRVSTGTYDENGKAIVKTLYARTIKELDAKVADLKSDITKGLYSANEGITFKEYAETWLKVSKASKGTRTKAMYSNILKNHTSLLDPKKLRDITPTDIQKQINALIDQPRTAQQLLMTIRQIIKAAQIDGILYKDPSAAAELPRRVKKERRALTEAEKKAIKAADFDAMEKAYIYTLYCTGMRPGEAFALTWSNIDFKTNEITINKSITFDDMGMPETVYPKTNSGIRIIQTHTMAMEALKAYKRENHHFNLFTDENGEIMRKYRYDTIWERCKRKIEKQLGHKTEITPYYFRHNFCTELYYSNVSLKEAQRLMGHSDINMIMKIYSHLDAKKENTKTKIQAINF